MVYRAPKPHGKQEHIESRLRRRSGMSPDKIAAMHAYGDTQPWTVMCRVCRANTTGLRSQLIECSNCGASFKR